MSGPKAPHESKIYHRLSHVYDSVFTPFFMARIHQTIRRLEIPPGARVLELGVGTGLSLEAYPEHAEVVGIDLSESMLTHARQKIDEHGWKHIELRQMDAMNLEFVDGSFDYVMAFHLVTVVPDPKRLMHEMTRVCKPGGTLVIINHLRSPRPWVAGFMDALNPITRRMGWQTKLSFENLVAGVPVKVLRRYKTSPQSLFTVVIAQKPSSSADNPGRTPAPQESELARPGVSKIATAAGNSAHRSRRNSERCTERRERRLSVLEFFSRSK